MNKSLLKVLISAAMLGLVLRLVDFKSLAATLFSVPLSAALLVFLGYIVGQIISATKWWIIAKASIPDAKLSDALKAYFLGMYVNCFGLGTVGGDVARALLIATPEGSSNKALSPSQRRTAAIASVVVDRAHGLAVLALLGALGAAIFGATLLPPLALAFIAALGPLIVLAWIFGLWLCLRLKLFVSVAETFSRAFPRKATTVVTISLLSLAFHLLQISLHSVMASAVGVELSWPTLLVFIPIINILSSLPISWNGLGVRESGYTFFLVPQFLSAEQAVTFGAIWLLAVTLSSAVGGIISFLTGEFKLWKTAPQST